jgi:hypothetical protein
MHGMTDEADEIARSEQRAGHRTFVSGGLEHVPNEPRGLPSSKWILAIAVAGVATAGAIALLRRARSRRGWFLPEREPSRWQAVAKTAGVWLLRVASRRIAQEVALRLTEPQPTPHVPAPPPVRPSAVQ